MCCSITPDLFPFSSVDVALVSRFCPFLFCYVPCTTFHIPGTRQLSLLRYFRQQNAKSRFQLRVTSDPRQSKADTRATDNLPELIPRPIIYICVSSLPLKRASPLVDPRGSLFNHADRSISLVLEHEAMSARGHGGSMCSPTPT